MNLTPERHWVCPNCPQTSVTRRADVHTEFHHCAGLRGVYAPMTVDGIRCKVELVEREDYIGADSLVIHDDRGRAVMGVRTTRDDGEDFAVHCPTALVRLS